MPGINSHQQVGTKKAKNNMVSWDDNLTLEGNLANICQQGGINLLHQPKQPIIEGTPQVTRGDKCKRFFSFGFSNAVENKHRAAADVRNRNTCNAIYFAAEVQHQDALRTAFLSVKISDKQMAQNERLHSEQMRQGRELAKELIGAVTECGDKTARGLDRLSTSVDRCTDKLVGEHEKNRVHFSQLNNQSIAATAEQGEWNRQTLMHGFDMQRQSADRNLAFGRECLAKKEELVQLQLRVNEELTERQIASQNRNADLDRALQKELHEDKCSLMRAGQQIVQAQNAEMIREQKRGNNIAEKMYQLKMKKFKAKSGHSGSQQQETESETENNMQQQEMSESSSTAVSTRRIRSAACPSSIRRNFQ